MLTAFAGVAHSQVSRADYDRALGMQAKFRGLVDHAPDAPHWIEGTHHFVYRRSTVAAPGRDPGYDFVWMNAETHAARLAFDHAKLAGALQLALGNPIKPEMLPLENYRIVDGETAIELVHANAIWRCDLAAYQCAKKRDLTPQDDDFDEGDDYDFTPKPINGDAGAKLSPDGKWLAYVENYNVVVRPKNAPLKTAMSDVAMQRTVLSEDGSEANYYAIDTLVWSPDSMHLAVYRIRPGYNRVIDYIESSPADQLQPKHSSMIYPKPGDVLPLYRPVLFDVAVRKEMPIDNALFPNPFELT